MIYLNKIECKYNPKLFVKQISKCDPINFCFILNLFQEIKGRFYYF